MRALPPPRKSRARSFRRLIRRLYQIITLQFSLNRRRSILVKRRRTPFHLTSRRYKVKLPRKHRTGTRWKYYFKKSSVPLKSTQLEDDLNHAQGFFAISQVQFNPVSLTRRNRFRPFNIDKMYTRRLIRKLIYKLYYSRSNRGSRNLNIVMDT